MKKKKQAKIRKPRNMWEINPKTRVHSEIGYKKKDRRKNKNIDENIDIVDMVFE